MAIINKIELPDGEVYDLKDAGAVAKTGDTMTGVLNVLDDIYAGSSTFTGQLNIVAKSDKGEYMLYNNGSTQSNSGAKGLYVKNSEGTGTSVILTDDSNNSTFYGNLRVTNNTNYTGTPSDSISKPMAQVIDTNNFIRHQIYGIYNTSGNSYTFLGVRKPGTNGGDPVTNQIGVGFDANGNKIYSITDSTAFRNTLGATSGLWPVTLGGTGATTPAAARTNLEITPANIGAKSTQTAVSSPSASGSASAFIDTISQNTQGVITVTKKNVTPASIGALALSGGTMTGNLTLKNSSSTASTVIYVNTNLSSGGLQLIADGKGGNVNFKSSDGTVEIQQDINSDRNFRIYNADKTSSGGYAYGYLMWERAGGGINLRGCNNYNYSQTRSATEQYGILTYAGTDGTSRFRIYTNKETDGTYKTYIMHGNSGASKGYVQLSFGIDINQNPSIGLSAGIRNSANTSTTNTTDAAKTSFRTAIGATAGVWPIAVGGTGRTSWSANQVVITDANGALSQTSQVPVARGGTGATTASGARTNLGITPENIDATRVIICDSECNTMALIYQKIKDLSTVTPATISMHTNALKALIGGSSTYSSVMRMGFVSKVTNDYYFFIPTTLGVIYTIHVPNWTAASTYGSRSIYKYTGSAFTPT